MDQVLRGGLGQPGRVGAGQALAVSRRRGQRGELGVGVREGPGGAGVHRLILGVTLMWLGDADRAWELLAEAARRAEDDDNRLARMCAEGYQALLAVNRGDIALADRSRATRSRRWATRSATRIS